MKIFGLVMEVCVAGLQRYNYKFESKHINEELTFQREPTNKYDTNAIIVLLNGVKIGYTKREDAVILAPILDHNNNLKIIKWIHITEKSTGGYMICHVKLKSG